jgi:hypothetical protein
LLGRGGVRRFGGLLGVAVAVAVVVTVGVGRLSGAETDGSAWSLAPPGSLSIASGVSSATAPIVIPARESKMSGRTLSSKEPSVGSPDCPCDFGTFRLLARTK